MNHSFNVEIAKTYGIPCAVILENFKFWISKNEADGRHVYDGRTWTYASIRGLSDRFPYLTEKQIRNALDKLKSNGVILIGNFNKRAFDRTLWYTLTDKGKSLFFGNGSHLPVGANAFAPEGEWICPTGQMHLPVEANAFAPEGEPIPYIDYRYSNPVIDTVSNQQEQRAREGDNTIGSEWGTFVQAYKDNLGPLEYSKPMVIEELTSLYDTMGAEVMTEAVRVTALKHTDNPRQYFMKLCRRWDEKGINTLEKARAAQMEHERGQNGDSNSGEHRRDTAEAPRRVGGETIV